MTDAIFDANSLFARSWYAAQRISTDPKEAVRLAINTILLLLNPDTNKIGSLFDRTLFAWDSHRDEDKDRAEKPPNYYETMDVLKEILAFMLNTVNVIHQNAEGDDIVSTVIHKGLREKHTSYVISGDKDLMQLQEENCQYYSLHDKALLSSAFIIHKFGNIKRPSQVALYLAIVGDPVDKIKGITGFGEVRCKKLFEAITPDMDLKTVIRVILNQLNERQREEFYYALERTLLKNDLVGIPDPSPLEFREPEEVYDLGIPQIGYYYREVHRIYLKEPF